MLYEQNAHFVYSIHSLPYISEDVNNKNDVEADFPSAEKRFSPTRAARGAEAQKRLRLEGEAVFYMMRCTDRFFIAQSLDLSLREFRNGQAGRAACRIRTRAIKANAPHPDKGLSVARPFADRRFTGTADQ